MELNHKLYYDWYSKIKLYLNLIKAVNVLFDFYLSLIIKSFKVLIFESLKHYQIILIQAHLKIKSLFFIFVFYYPKT